MKPRPEKESHPIRNGIIATVIGGIILSAILSVFPTLRSLVLKVIYWLWSGIVWTYKVSINTYSIPGWVLVLIGILALKGAIDIYFAIRPSDNPDYYKYKEAFIYGVKWRWSWIDNKVANLWCYCPHCDAQLVYDDSSCHILFSDVKKTDFICERCGHQVITSISGGAKNYAVGAAEREIYRRIRTGEYKSAIN